MQYPHTHKPSLKPLFIALGAAAIAVGTKAASLLTQPGAVSNAAEKAFILFLVIAVVFSLRWLIADAPFNLLRRFTVAPFMRTMVSLILYFGGAMYLLHGLFAINILPLLTTSAVITGIMALSLQDTLKNLFTGLWINTERTVQRGDWVKVNGREGLVCEVTWRTTRLLTRENDYIYIPNRLLAEDVLENYTYPTPLHVLDLSFNAAYKDPPNKVMGILRDVAVNNRAALSEPAPEVWMSGFGDFSAHYRLRVWINDYKRAPLVSTEINSNVWYAFRRASIEMPYPVRTLYHRREEPPLSSEHVYDALKGIDFLASLDEESLRSAAIEASVESFGKGEIIVSQGKEGESCYFIDTGRAEVRHRGGNGADEFVASLGPGDFFGEMGLLTGEPRNATVAASEDCLCIVIKSDTFKRIFEAHPEFAGMVSASLAHREAGLNAVKDKTASSQVSEEQAGENILGAIKRFFNMR